MYPYIEIYNVGIHTVRIFKLKYMYYNKYYTIGNLIYWEILLTNFVKINSSMQNKLLKLKSSHDLLLF